MRRMPESSTPTRTAWLPRRMAYEPTAVAWIMSLSQWRLESGSSDTAAPRARGTAGGSVANLFARTRGIRASGTRGVTPTSARDRSARAANPRERVRTVATPISRFSLTIVPPAARTAARASAVAPRRSTTTYSWP
jgi:hypothetical protein